MEKSNDLAYMQIDFTVAVVGECWHSHRFGSINIRKPKALGRVSTGSRQAAMTILFHVEWLAGTLSEMKLAAWFGKSLSQGLPTGTGSSAWKAQTSYASG